AAYDLPRGSDRLSRVSAAMRPQFSSDFFSSCLVRESSSLPVAAQSFHSKRARVYALQPILALAFVFAWSAPTLFAAVVESAGDATIDHQVRRGAWTIAAGGAAMSFTIDASKDYTVNAILSPTSTNWARLAAPDVIVTSDGTRHLLGSG